MTDLHRLDIPKCRFCGRVINDFHSRSCRLACLRVHANHTVRSRDAAASQAQAGRT